ncbi:MAG: putative type IV restriction endonuclease [Parcubacteria group bacterium Licking1014_17]|nr:MAG: putative type IV restriction endonuclease [Parcubacteria group bacterium Licking1014_17]
MTQQEAKDRIKRLLEKYQQAHASGQDKKYNEAQTISGFIMPLFESLGWNQSNLDEVIPQESSSKGRVDFAFQINHIPVMFLEAKAMKVDLDEWKWAEQAINYSWNKGVTWAILTDFESIKVFNAEVPPRNVAVNQFFEIKCGEYLEKFDQLWLLSKESFEKKLLHEKAEEWGKLAKRKQVGEKLFEDLMKWRVIIEKSFRKNNRWTVDQEIIDEGVQKILDRLIFIRTAEDRGLESRHLEGILHSYKKSAETADVYKLLIEVFRYFDKEYDSKLFEKHDCETWKLEDTPMIAVLGGLYNTEDGYRYDFSAISADVLGGIYEQYLSYVQGKKSEEKSKSKRKSQGIYYTPKYIVDYIVSQTLKPVLDKCHSLFDLKKIRVLDPACGSGSFLIKALDVIAEKYKEFDKKPANVFTKIQILEQNIYGVDLDPQAVEIARLNLLLNSLDSRMKLPALEHTIHVGNSLISGSDEELKKYFGPNFRDKKPFNWQEEFREVFEQGGFDVVIGNPPYLKEMDNKDVFEPIKSSGYREYYQGKMDFWYFFLHRAIDVVKESGLIGFITNSYFLKSAGASKLIRRIKNELILIKAVDLDDIKVFGDVSGKHIIHIYQKRQADKADKTILIKISKDNFADFIDEKNKKVIPYQKIIVGDKINFEVSSDANLKNCTSLGDIYDVSQGVVEATDKISKKQADATNNFKTGDGVFVLSKKEVNDLHLSAEEKKLVKKYLDVSDVGKYFILFNNEYLIYADKEAKSKITDGLYPNIKNHLDKMKRFITSSNKPYGLHRPRESKYFENPKLICEGMFLSPGFYYDEDKYYVGFSFSVIVQKDKNYSLKYLLGVLNSKFAGNWFNVNGKKRGVGVDIGVLVFRQFPIYRATADQQNNIENLVDKILSLNKEFHKLPENSEKWQSLKSEIDKTDHRIDEEVYKLYNLTPEEIKIIENRQINGE